MSKIQLHATFTIQKGKTKAFRSIANKCIKVAKKKDPGTLGYEWFYTENGRGCLVHESYKSSKACLAHMANVDPLIAKLLKISKISSVVIGKPSKKLSKKLKQFGTPIYHFEQGF